MTSALAHQFKQIVAPGRMAVTRKQTDISLIEHMPELFTTPELRNKFFLTDQEAYRVVRRGVRLKLCERTGLLQDGKVLYRKKGLPGSIL